MKRVVLTFFGTTILNYLDLASFCSLNFAKAYDKILLEVIKFLMSLFLNHSKRWYILQIYKYAYSIKISEFNISNYFFKSYCPPIFSLNSCGNSQWWVAVKFPQAKMIIQSCLIIFLEHSLFCNLFISEGIVSLILQICLRDNIKELFPASVTSVRRLLFF